MKNTKNENVDIKYFAKNIRKNILNMAFTAGASSAHIGGALSIADIMSVLFVTKMRFKEKDPLFNNRVYEHFIPICIRYCFHTIIYS